MSQVLAPQIRKPTLAQASVGKSAIYLIFVGCVATAIAALVGLLFVLMATFPISLFSLLVIPQIFGLLWDGAILASPITLVLLPVTAMLGRKYPIVLYFSLPFIGLIGGNLAMRIWPIFQQTPPMEGRGGELLIWTGAFAGFIAGGIFSAAIREMRR